MADMVFPPGSPPTRRIGLDRAYQANQLLAGEEPGRGAARAATRPGT